LHQTSETKKKLGTLTFFYPKHNQSSSKQVPNQTLTFHIMQTHHTNQYSSKEALQFLSSKNCPLYIEKAEEQQQEFFRFCCSSR